MEVANNLDTRIGRFEQLLVGRAEHVTEQIEVRTKAAADALQRAHGAAWPSSIKTNSTEATQALGLAERRSLQAWSAGFKPAEKSRALDRGRSRAVAQTLATDKRRTDVEKPWSGRAPGVGKPPAQPVAMARRSTADTARC